MAIEAERRKIEEDRKREQEEKQRKDEAEAFDKMFDTVIKQEVTQAMEQRSFTSTRGNDQLPAKLSKSVVPDSQVVIEADPETSKPKVAFSLMTRGRGKDKAPQFSKVRMDGDMQMMVRIQEERAKQQAEADLIKQATACRKMCDDLVKWKK